MNKQFYFLILSLFTLPYLTNCQSSITPFIGYNHSSVHITIPEFNRAKHRNNYFIGLEYKTQLNKFLSYSTSAQFSNKGWQNREKSYKESFKYIDILHQVHFSPIRNVSMNGGINTGFLINKKDNLAEKVFDLGLVFGLGYEIKRMNVYLNYNHGLVNLLGNSYKTQDGREVMRNSNIQIGIGYRFKYNKEENLDEYIQPEKNNYEIGIKFSSFNSGFNFIFKKETSSNKFVRMGVLTSNLNYVFADNKENELSSSIGLSMGLENRVNFTDQMQFLHGFEPSIGFIFTRNGSNTFVPYFGYVLGLQFNISPNIYIGMETIPSISAPLKYNSFSNSTDAIILNLEITSRVQLFATYRFSK